MHAMGSRNYYVIDTRRSGSENSFTLTHHRVEGPPDPYTPDDPNTPDDEEVVGVGSTAEWWDFHSPQTASPNEVTLKRVFERVRKRIKSLADCAELVKELNIDDVIRRSSSGTLSS